MGKTSLLRHFSAEMDASTLLTARGEQDESLYPYAVFEQLLDALPAGAELLRLLRSRRGEDPLAIGAGFLEVLNELDRTGPVVVVVDDVHWAGTPSAQALCFALRRLRFDHVLAVLALRPLSGPGPHASGGARSPRASAIVLVWWRKTCS